jgi:hypothetical protein
MQEGIGAVEGNGTHRPSASVGRRCDGLRDRRCQGGQESAARRKCPKRAIFSLQDGGGSGGNIGANTPDRPKQPRNTQNKFLANGFAVPTTQAWRPASFYRQTSRHNLSSSASTSKLWENGEAREKNSGTSSFCFNSNGSLAVFPTDVCTVSQSSIELKLLPLNYVTTPSPVAFEEAPSRAPSRAGSSAERRGPDPGPRRSPTVPVCVERLGLLQNTGEGHPKGKPNAWRLTSKGLQLTQPIPRRAAIPS